ncbi:hypothetical protein [Streptomyces sp. NPDC014734]|uniref:hypothetical protein n=1 Tax=Streptomyces sp. NPDC014734 TaxID=3364886 RepID=UPI0036FC484F
MRAAHARQLRRMRARRRVSLPLAALTIVVTAIGLTTFDWLWWMTLPSSLCVLILLGCANFVSDDEVERPRPDTVLEVACVVGVEITSWARADPGGVHRVRVIARPLASEAGQLVHGYRTFRADRGCRIAPGMLFGFRRHPAMKHLVWIEPHHDPLALLHHREGTDPAPSTRPEDATIESVAVTDEHDGDRWQTTIKIRTDDGTRLTETSYRLPEELGKFEPGHRVQIIRRQNAPGALTPTPTTTTCSIVPRTL